MNRVVRINDVVRPESSIGGKSSSDSESRTQSDSLCGDTSITDGEFFDEYTIDEKIVYYTIVGGDSINHDASDDIDHCLFTDENHIEGHTVNDDDNVDIQVSFCFIGANTVDDEINTVYEAYKTINDGVIIDDTISDLKTKIGGQSCFFNARAHIS
ncbi:hypothetical protein NDU88_000190 [Pleurodeles waltl]|uniref:Uncharacterized protein n=1 Tax=Pleurodeles waltl TaxID=8319 RepID=A0AAV7S7H3_PLEWA|nr:hypothetical protein NDU88_000190 [Pleurodeles waltl]